MERKQKRSPEGGYGMFGGVTAAERLLAVEPQRGRGMFDALFGIDGPRYQTWPERSAREALSAAALPGDVLTGKVSLRDSEGRLSEEIIGRAFDLAGSLSFPPLFGAPAGSLGSGAVRPLFRETGPDRARQFVPGGNYSGRNPFGRDEFFFADDPAMALGQAGNQGVLMQLNPAMFTTRAHTEKPGLQFSSSKELVGTPNRDVRLEDSLQGMLLNKRRLNSRDPDAVFLNRNAQRMGWEMIETPSGLILRRPGDDIEFLRAFAEGRGA